MEQKALHVSSLSSKLQTMKFMQRDSKSKKEPINSKSQVNQEEYWRIQYSAEELEKLGITTEKQNRKIKTKSVQSFLSLGQDPQPTSEPEEASSQGSQLVGRKSFHQFNPKIEKLEQEQQAQVKVELDTQKLKKVNVSDVEMSKFYARKRAKHESK